MSESKEIKKIERKEKNRKIAKYKENKKNNNKKEAWGVAAAGYGCGLELRGSI